MADNYGFLLTITGCPYAFATTNINTGFLPTGSVDYPTGVDAAHVVLGSLDIPTGWSYAVQLPDFSLQCSSQTFRIFDKSITAIETSSSVNIGSYLFTKFNQEYVELTGDVLSGSTSLIPFNAPNIFPTSGNPFPVWIEDEAILCNPYVGTNLQVLSRGYLGTPNKDHFADNVNNIMLQAYLDYPGIIKRKVLLWRYDGSAWSILWRGVVGRAPVLDNNPAVWNLQCDHIYTTSQNKRYNVKNTAATLRGFNSNNIWASVTWTGSVSLPYHAMPNNWGTETDSVTPYGASLANQVNSALRNSNSSTSLLTNCQLFGDKLRIRCSVRDVNGIQAQVAIGKRVSAQVLESYITNNYHTIEFDLDAPTALEVTDITATNLYLHLSNTSSLPTSFSSVGNYTTAIVTDMFSVEMDETDTVAAPYTAWYFPSSYVSTPGDRFASSKIKCSSVVARPSKATTVVGTSPFRRLFAYSEKPAVYGKQIKSSHWFRALHYGIVNQFLDYRDYDFSNENQVLAETPNMGTLTNSIEWNCTPDKKIFDVPNQYLKLFCVAPSIGASGSIRFVPLKAPGPNLHTTVNLTQADYVVGALPGYSQDSTDTLVTSVVYKSELYPGDITINNNRMIAQSEGAGKTVTFDLSTCTDLARFQSGTTFLSNLTLLTISTYFGLLGKPFAQATISVDLSWLDTINVGDYISITDNIIVSNRGTRGVANRIAWVAGKKVALKGKGKIDLTLFLFDDSRYSGYSPCVRVASIAGAALTINTGYLNDGTTATDYAGSNISGYTGTANDGGTSMFAVGDKVDLIHRNDTTYTSFSSYVSSIDIPGKKITLNAAPGGSWGTWALAGEVDLRYSAYNTAGLQTPQKTYSWVGSQANGYILGSTDRVQRFTY